MKNVLFTKKFTQANHNSYIVGWDKALQNFQKVLEDEKSSQKSKQIFMRPSSFFDNRRKNYL